MKQKTFSLQERFSSFGFAFNGIAGFLRQEHNARIHFAVTVMVFASAIYFEVSTIEMIALVIVSGFVWVAEVFNTAIERIMDFISTKQNTEIKFIKDLAAGGVLLSTLIAIITGAIVFIPKLF
jgi:diacylglycerol kinase (ATP)